MLFILSTAHSAIGKPQGDAWAIDRLYFHGVQNTKASPSHCARAIARKGQRRSSRVLGQVPFMQLTGTLGTPEKTSRAEDYHGSR